MASHKQAVFNLYRNILRQHQYKLTHSQRLLADAYVKKEFHDHKAAKREYVQGFMDAWKEYLHQIRSQPNPGRDLSEDELLSLSPEQRLQLEKLRAEATRKE